MHDDDLTDPYAGAAWHPLFDATTPLDVLLRRIDDRTTRALAEFLDTIAADPDLTEAERADVRAYLDHVTPMLRERARADARRAYARLQAEAIADACPASRLTH